MGGARVRQSAAETVARFVGDQPKSDASYSLCKRSRPVVKCYLFEQFAQDGNPHGEYCYTFVIH